MTVDHAPVDLSYQILRFARRLKEAGLAVTLGRSLGAINGLDFIQLREKEELFVLLSTHFVSRPEELPVFERLFDEFWCKAEERTLPERVLPGLKIPVEIIGEDEEPRKGRKKEALTVNYSPEENLRRKDFGDLSEKEAEEIDEIILALSRNIGLHLSRRYKSAFKGKRIDFPGTWRRSLGYGGELLALKKKKRKVKKDRFVVLCDVSGSMDRYSRFLLRFLYGFQKKVPRVETFVFSTRLSRVTELMRLRDMKGAYHQIAAKVKDWSGGTRIGSALSEYNRRYGGKFSNPRTNFIFLSDGWDQGEISLLDQELKALKRRVRRLIWLNPLLGLPDYKPLDRGMSTALPYTDHFLDCHDLDRLEEFGKTLQKVC